MFVSYAKGILINEWSSLKWNYKSFQVSACVTALLKHIIIKKNNSLKENWKEKSVWAE